MTGPGPQSSDKKQAEPRAPHASEIVHATCVAVAGRGLLIMGGSGRGKSGLALRMMALGAGLVADDRVMLNLQRDRVIASAPKVIGGLIEARGLGLLHATPHPPVPVMAVLDLNTTETERLPGQRTTRLLGQSVTLLHNADSAHFPAALMQYLKAGRRGV